MFKWNTSSSCILKSWLRNSKPRFCRIFVERLSFNDRIPRRFEMELLNLAEKLSSRLLCEKSKVRSWRESIEDIDLQSVIVSYVVIKLSLLRWKKNKEWIRELGKDCCWINVMYLRLSERLLSYVYVFKNCEIDCRLWDVVLLSLFGGEEKRQQKKRYDNSEYNNNSDIILGNYYCK